MPSDRPTSPKRPAPDRLGFTLVELLIVTAIVGTLVAIAAPAVQAARESARQIHCKNNLKQLALASYNHHDVHGHFPTGGWGWFWVGDPDRGYGKEQPGGWIYNLLPYYDESALHDLPSDGDPDFPSRHQQRMAGKLVQSPLTIINCPSRRPNVLFPMTTNAGGSSGYYNSITPKTAGRSDYAMNSGHVYNQWNDHDLGRGPRSYAEADLWTASKAWASDQRRWTEHDGGLTLTGISFERSVIGLRHVRDGTSKTYAIGERHIPEASYFTGDSGGDNETWCTGFNNDNYRRTGRIKNGEDTELLPLPDYRHDPGSGGSDGVGHSAGGRFGSAHPANWNVSFCDGSVRTLAYDLDWRLHRDLGNRQDGKPSIQPNSE